MTASSFRATVFSLFISFAGIVSATQCAVAGVPFINGIASLESGTVTTATNPNSTSVGEYQDTQAALASAGVLKINSQPTSAQFGAGGQWTNVTFLPNKWGITSKQQLLDAPASTQTAIEQSYLQSTWQQDQSQGLTSYLGQSVNGQTMNQSAILGCSEFLGTTGCQNYLSTGSAGSNTAAAEQLISQDSQFDSSAITGTSTQVAQSQPGLGPGQEDLAGLGMYCDTSTSTAIAQGAQNEVQGQVAIAESPQTGYTLVNGSSPIAPVMGGGFGAQTCLSSLVGYLQNNSIFDIPDVNGLLTQLVNMTCDKIQSTVENALAPIQNRFYQASQNDGFSAGMGALEQVQSMTASQGTPIPYGQIMGPLADPPITSGFGQPITYGGAF